MPCCTIDGECFQPFMLAGEDAEPLDRATAGPGLKRIEFLVPAGQPRRRHGADRSRHWRSSPGVKSARVNLTGRRVAVTYARRRHRTAGLDRPAGRAGLHGAALRSARDRPRSRTIATAAKLLKALAVAGFAAGNVMLLSVSVWSGAEDATRDLFHWLSAMIALPAVAYAGRPFFHSAVNALRLGRVNMDVPISLGVLLASAMSLFETINGAEHAYFDASVTLLFFLLAGRYLDHLMRARARSAVAQLVSLSAEAPPSSKPTARRRYVAARDLKPGMRIAIAAGDRLPADGRVIDGISDIDRSLLTGESAPETVQARQRRSMPANSTSPAR